MLEWAVFHGQVGQGRWERGGHLRTLVEQLVANVDPPGVSAASIRLPRHAATVSLVRQALAHMRGGKTHLERRRAPRDRRSARPAYADEVGALQPVRKLILITCGQRTRGPMQPRRLP